MNSGLVALAGIFFLAHNAQSRHLLGAEQHIKFRIVHRSSPDSPHWKPEYRSQIHVLRELVALDQERLRSFGRILQEKTFPQALIRDDLREDHPLLASRLVSGSSIGSGQYFAELSIGTPPRKFSLIVDTGSDLTWIQCSPPKNSSLSPSLLVPWYDKSSSSSYREIPCTAGECLFVPAPIGSNCSAKNPNPCDYTYSYSDQSRTSGILVYETVSMKSAAKYENYGKRNRAREIRIENVALGCSSESVGSSFLGASGVLGLGHGPVSFPTQTRHTALGGIFSYCLVDYLRGSNASSLLVMGRTPRRSIGLSYTPLVRNAAAESFYYVNVTDVFVGGKVVKGIGRDSWRIDQDGNKGTIFDSGSTLSYFREPIYYKVLGALNQSIQLPFADQSPQGFDLCYNVTTMPKKMPKVAIKFQGGGVMKMPWNNYMVLVAQNVQCVAFQQVRTSFGFNIIGNLLQQEFHMEYDRKNSRIGFKRYPCAENKVK